MRLILLLTLIYSSLLSSQLETDIEQNLLQEKQIVKSLYRMNSNHPLWIGHANNFHALTKALQDPYFNYKDKRFDRDIIEEYGHLLHNDMDISQNSKELAKLDVALTKSYIALADFIVKSDIDWDKVSAKLVELKETKKVNAHWEMVRKTTPSTTKLFNAITNQNIDIFFNSLTPLPERHRKLVNALEKYKNIYDDEKIHYGMNFQGLKYGDIDTRIEKIKKRLAIFGDYPERSAYTNHFGKKLQYALYSYKCRFNLEQNELIDKITIYYINKPIKLLVDAIISNLDKLKIFPNQFPNEYILVNIPDFTMDYYKNDASILHMNAVIGRDERPTPIFSSSMTYLELNPSWNIPESLVRKDLIPTMIEHPDYLEEHNIHAFNGWGGNSKEIKNFPVSKLLPYQDKENGHIPYRFVQYPGDDNALGRIKFMFPNKYSVYLHDTDNKSLFSRRYRVYSSGCMRLQKPFELLEVLKSRIKLKDIKQIDKYRNNLTNKVIRFTKSLPVHTAYFTVFIKDGLTYFRKDIYGYDKFIRESAIKDIQ